MTAERRKRLYVAYFLVLVSIFLYGLFNISIVQASEDVSVGAIVENIEHIRNNSYFTVDKDEILVGERVIITLYALSDTDPLIGYGWQVNITPNNLSNFVYQQLLTDNEGRAVAVIEGTNLGTIYIDVSIRLLNGSYLDIPQVKSVNIIGSVTPVDPTEPTDPTTPVEPGDSTDPTTPSDTDDPTTPSDPDSPIIPDDIGESDETKFITDTGVRFFDLLISTLERIHIPAVFVSLLLALTQLSFWYFLVYLFQLLLALLGIRKLKKIGVVCDSLTKQPIARAIIRIFNRDTNKIIGTAVSDIRGYFWVPIEKVPARLTVQRVGYVFPSAIVLSKEDVPYKNVVREIVDDLTEPMSIPLDPESRIIWHVKFWRFVKNTFYFVNNFLLVAFVFLNIYFYMINRNVFSLIGFICGIFIVFVKFINWLLINRNVRSGVVKYSDGTVAEGVVIDLIDLEFNQLVQRRITNKLGKYLLYIPPGKYSIKCTDPMNNVVKEIEIVENKNPKQEKTYNKKIII